MQQVRKIPPSIPRNLIASMRRAWSHCTNDGHWNMSQHPERPHSPPHAKTQAELQRPLSPRAILWMSRDAFTNPHIRGDAHNNQQYAARHRPVKNRWLWQKQRPKLAQKRKLAEPFHVRRPGREAFGTAFGLCSAKAAQGRGPQSAEATEWLSRANSTPR